MQLFPYNLILSCPQSESRVVTLVTVLGRQSEPQWMNSGRLGQLIDQDRRQQQARNRPL